MKRSLTPEIAMAIQKGEVNYAHLLCEFESVRASDNVAVHVDNLNKNQKLGYENLVRRLRDAA